MSCTAHKFVTSTTWLHLVTACVYIISTGAVIPLIKPLVFCKIFFGDHLSFRNKSAVTLIYPAGSCGKKISTWKKVS